MQNIYFTDNFQKLPPRDSSMIRHGNSDPCLTTYWNISKKQRSPHFINRLMSSCSSSRVHCCSAWAWFASTWKISKSSDVLNFGFVVDKSTHIYMSLTRTWERKETLSLVLVNQLYYGFVKVWRTPIVIPIMPISLLVPRLLQSS